MKRVEALLDKVQANIDLLKRQTLAELGLLWEHCLPKRLMPSLKCLIWRELAWHLQESKQPLAITTQRLIQSAMKVDLTKPSSAAFTPTPKLAPIPEGSRFVRKWRDHHYEVVNNGKEYLFNGKSYKSLTHIAREITGTHQSGPMFFGLHKHRKENSYV